MMALSMLLTLIFRKLNELLSGSHFNLMVPFVPRGCFVLTALITQLMSFISHPSIMEKVLVRRKVQP